MNIKIEKFFMLLSLLLFILGSFLLFYIFELNSNSSRLREVENNRYLMIKKADELRQSSDDLSRLANKYVITANTMYKDHYFTTLAIRNGKSKRPAHYDAIYWDLPQDLRDENHPLEKAISLKEEMKKLPYTKWEFEKLTNAEDNSNDLVNLEIEAFNAMKGLFKDANGKYSIKSKPNQQLAIKLMNSKEYDRAKEKIMIPIDEFLYSLDNRTQQLSNEYNKKINNTFEKIFILLSLGGLLFILTNILIKKKILIPVSSLTHTMLDYQIGKSDVEEIIYYYDEIGLMTKQFFAMKKKISDSFEAIKLLSLTDPLTKIGNRRSFFDLSEQLLKIAHRDNDQMSLMMLDIDFFKKVNDTYGHLIGDEILKFLAENVQKKLRDSDVFGRYGGEEFIILLPKTKVSGAMVVAENIRKHIEQSVYTDNNHSIKITISIGVTESLQDDVEMRTIIQRADEALYVAKGRGRNRVEFC